MTALRVFVVAGAAPAVPDLAARLGRLGFAVCGQTASLDGLDTALAGAADLLVVDAGEGGCGLAAGAARLRAAGALPVVCLTSAAEAAVADAAVADDPFGTLAAPVEDRALHATLQAAYYRHQALRLPPDALRRIADGLRADAGPPRQGRWELALPAWRLTWSPELYALYERDPAQPPSLAEAMAIYAPEARSLIAAAVQAAIDHGTSWDLDLPATTGSGRRLWVRSRGVAVREQGGVTRLVATTEDITGTRGAVEALASKTRLFETMLAAMPDGVLVSQADGFVADNDALYETFGLDPAALRGSPDPIAAILRALAELGEYGPGDPAALAAQRRAELSAALQRDGRLQYVRAFRDGRRVEARIQAIPGGGVLGIHRDVTDRDQRESELARQSVVLDTILANMSEGLTVVDAELRLIAWNQRWLDMMDLDPARLYPGMPLRELVAMQVRDGDFGPYDDADALADRLLHERWTGPDAVPLAARTRRNGRIIERRRNPVPGGGFVTTYTDITERHREETAVRDANEMLAQRVAERTAALAASEARTRRIIDTALDAVFTADGAGIVTAWNPQAEAMLGLPAAQAVGRPLRALLVPARDPKRLEARLRRLLDDPDPLPPDRRVELTLRRADGSEIAVALRMTRFTADGTRWISGFMTDVTARKAAEAALQAARDSLHDLVESMPLSLLLLDAEDRVVISNGELIARYPGVGESARAGARFEALFRAAVESGAVVPPPGGTAERLVADRLAYFRSGARTPFILHLADGRVIEVIERPASNGGLVVIGTDVTELRTARLNLQDAVDTLTHGLVLYDADGRAVVFNSTFVEHFKEVADLIRVGVSFETLYRAAIARGVVPMPPGADPEAVLAARVAEHRAASGRVSIRHLADGRVIEVTERRARNGGILAVGADVTALYRARSDLQDAIDSMVHGLVLLDADDRIVVYNQTFSDHFAPVDDLVRVGADFADLLRAMVERGAMAVPDGVTRERFLAACIAHHRAADAKVRVTQLADGRVLEVIGRRTKSGGILATGIDMTERRAIDRQLREAQKMEAIGKLTGGLAHDFNNYLGTIVGNLDLVREEPALDAQSRKLVDAAIAGAIKGADLTRSLLAFARRQTLDPRPTDVNQRVASIAGLLARTLGADVELVTWLQPGLWPVRVDGAQLDSCILNLANNARDAMPSGGRLTIATANLTLADVAAGLEAGMPAGERVLIEIADSGDGMPAEVLENAFEPFFTTKPVGHGTGLGLSMVYGFVKQSGGHIRIDSRPGRGTVVRIYLPRDVSAAARDADAAEAAGGALSQPGGRETVLVVEDNPQMRATAVAQLDALGYAVIEATNGVEALALIDDPAHRIDLLFSDVVMPGGLDGHALVGQARARRPGLPALLTSGYPGERPDTAPGDAPLLKKPYRKAELAQAVRRALDARA